MKDTVLEPDRKYWLPSFRVPFLSTGLEKQWLRTKTLKKVKHFTRWWRWLTEGPYANSQTSIPSTDPCLTHQTCHPNWGESLWVTMGWELRAFLTETALLLGEKSFQMVFPQFFSFKNFSLGLDLSLFQSVLWNYFILPFISILWKNIKEENEGKISHSVWVL